MDTATMIQFDEDYFGMAPPRHGRPPVKRVKTPYPTPKQIRDNLLLPPLRVDTELSEASSVFDRYSSGSEITDVSSIGERELDDYDHEVDGKVKVGVVEADSGFGGSSTAGSSSMGAAVESKDDGSEVGILEGGEGEAAIDEIGEEEEEEEEPKPDAVIKGYNCCRCSTYNQIPLSTASVPLAGATDNAASSSSSFFIKASKDRRNINIPFRAQSSRQKCSCGHTQCRRRCRIEWRISHKLLAEQRMLKGSKRIHAGKKVTTKDGKKKEEAVPGNDGLRWGWCTKEFLDKVDRNWDEDGNRRVSLEDGGVQERDKCW